MRKLLLALFIFMHFAANADDTAIKLKKPNDAYYKHGILPAAKGTIIYNIEVETPKHNQDHLRYETSAQQETHPTVLKKTVSILVIPTEDKILQEMGDFGYSVNKKSGIREKSSFTKGELLLYVLGSAINSTATNVYMFDQHMNKKYDRVHSSAYPTQDLQNAIVVTKNEHGDYVKVCDQISMISDYPSSTFFEKFTAHDLQRLNKHSQKQRKYSIVEFNPECFNTDEKRIIVFYTHAQSRHGGYRFVKSTMDDDLKQQIAKDFGLDYKINK